MTTATTETTLGAVVPIDRGTWERAIRDSELAPQVRYVALLAATYGDWDGTNIRPGLDDLARAAGMPRRTLQRRLAEAAGAGWITQTSRGGGPSRRAAEWALTVPDDIRTRATQEWRQFSSELAPSMSGASYWPVTNSSGELAPSKVARVSENSRQRPPSDLRFSAPPKRLTNLGLYSTSPARAQPDNDAPPTPMPDHLRPILTPSRARPSTPTERTKEMTSQEITELLKSSTPLFTARRAVCGCRIGKIWKTSEGQHIYIGVDKRGKEKRQPRVVEINTSEIDTPWTCDHAQGTVDMTALSNSIKSNPGRRSVAIC